MATRNLLGTAFAAMLPLTSLFWCPGTAHAVSTIKQPGMHPHYSVELEPHLLFDFDGGNRYADDDGFGPGMRFAIPIVDDGPITKINNSMAIGFGVDWSSHDGHCVGRDCDVNQFWFPVVLQWNFWLTDVISVFGEPGLAFRHTTWDDELCVDRRCNDDSDNDLKPTFWAGGRFMFSDTVGGVVRLGWPYVSLGINFLL